MMRKIVCLLSAAALAGAQAQNQPQVQTMQGSGSGNVCSGDCTKGREKVKDVRFDANGGFR